MRYSPHQKEEGQFPRPGTLWVKEAVPVPNFYGVSAPDTPVPCPISSRRPDS